MPSTDDMTRPVTHGELREILSEAFAAHTTFMLAEISKIVAREVAREVARAVPIAVAHAVEGLEESLRLLVAREVAQAARSLDESIRSYMGVLLDKASANDAVLDTKYSDLPPRVTRLEVAVFPPKRPRRRRSA